MTSVDVSTLVMQILRYHFEVKHSRVSVSFGWGTHVGTKYFSYKKCVSPKLFSTSLIKTVQPEENSQQFIALTFQAELVQAPPSTSAPRNFQFPIRASFSHPY